MRREYWRGGAILRNHSQKQKQEKKQKIKTEASVKPLSLTLLIFVFANEAVLLVSQDSVPPPPLQ
jgi:hypothetical protein